MFKSFPVVMVLLLAASSLFPMKNVIRDNDYYSITKEEKKILQGQMTLEQLQDLTFEGILNEHIFVKNNTPKNIYIIPMTATKKNGKIDHLDRVTVVSPGETAYFQFFTENATYKIATEDYNMIRAVPCLSVLLKNQACMNLKPTNIMSPKKM